VVVLRADWNDTRFFNEEFDKMLLSARGELDEAKRKQIYRDMGSIVSRPEADKAYDRAFSGCSALCCIQA